MTATNFKKSEYSLRETDDPNLPIWLVERLPFEVTLSGGKANPVVNFEWFFPFAIEVLEAAQADNEVYSYSYRLMGENELGRRHMKQFKDQRPPKAVMSVNSMLSLMERSELSHCKQYIDRVYTPSKLMASVAAAASDKTSRGYERLPGIPLSYKVIAANGWRFFTEEWSSTMEEDDYDDALLEVIGYEEEENFEIEKQKQSLTVSAARRLIFEETIEKYGDEENFYKADGTINLKFFNTVCDLKATKIELESLNLYQRPGADETAAETTDEESDAETGAETGAETDASQKE